MNSLEDILADLKIKNNDVILYLGGRIDDSNLYPPKYVEYLREKIKIINPTTIICHNYWYAKKYYEKQILPQDTKIDIILGYLEYFVKGELQTIEPKEYTGHKNWVKILVEKNPNLVYAFYQFPNKTCELKDSKFNDEVFGKDYNLNNLKCFNMEREYSPKLFDDLGWTNNIASKHGEKSRNATDGFRVITKLIGAGFSNLNILGFTAFGSDEDQSYHTTYGYKRYAGQKYFDLKTSEDQRAEADILQSMVLNQKINNLENYDKLIQYLNRK